MITVWMYDFTRRMTCGCYRRLLAGCRGPIACLVNISLPMIWFRNARLRSKPLKSLLACTMVLRKEGYNSKGLFGVQSPPCLDNVDPYEWCHISTVMLAIHLRRSAFGWSQCSLFASLLMRDLFQNCLRMVSADNLLNRSQLISMKAHRLPTTITIS